jgi:hypothetical protein
MNRRSLALLALAGWASAALALGCAHPLAGIPGPLPSPSGNPSPSGSPTPATCATQDPSATLVYMSANAAPTVDPTYGPLFGYTDSLDAFNNPMPTHILSVPAGAIVQFVNFDFAENHAAASLPGPLFPPATPDPFPSNADQMIGSSISSGPWSTGIVAPANSVFCFSQAFTTPATGTFLFGEPATYFATNTRDVLIVTAFEKARPIRRARLPSGSARSRPARARGFP